MTSDPLELVNVADDQPKVVAQLVNQYDQWFDDVSTTRTDNWSPPAIVIGSEASPDVCLTRQDWRKLDGPGWSNHSQGHWWIDAVHPGPYDVRVRFLPSSEVNQMELICGKVERKKSVKPGAKEVKLEGVMLPEGQNWLRVDLALPGKTVGPYQVEFHHVGPELGKLGTSGPEWVRLDSQYGKARYAGDNNTMFHSAFQMLHLATTNSGSQSRDFIYSMNRVANYLLNTEREVAGQRILRYTTNRYHQVLGPNHPETLQYRGIREQVVKNNPKGALAYFQKAHQSCAIMGKLRHDYEFMFALSIANLYTRLGKDDLHRRYWESAKNSMNQSPVASWYDRSLLLASLGRNHNARNEWEKSLAIGLEILDMKKAHQLPTAPSIADSHWVIAYFAQKTGDLNLARTNYLEAMGIYELNFGAKSTQLQETRVLLKQVEDLLEERSF